MTGAEQKVPDLHDDLQEELRKYRATRGFIVEDGTVKSQKWADDKCAKFNKYMTDHKLSGCCVSLSGGIDSALTYALMIHAKKQPDSPIKRVVGIAQPIHSSDWALERATMAHNKLAPNKEADFIVVDQTQLHDQLKGIVDQALGVEGGAFAGGQLRSYQRAPVQYYVAQLISQSGNPCLVMGTGNQDEDGYLAYFCKAGDGVVDLQLIADLHKSEVKEVARTLGVPDAIVKAPPSADLWEDQSDEEELGFTYDFIELWTGVYLPKSDDEKKEFENGLSPDALKQFQEWGAKCKAIHERNKHKLAGVINL